MDCLKGGQNKDICLCWMYLQNIFRPPLDLCILAMPGKTQWNIHFTSPYYTLIMGKAYTLLRSTIHIPVFQKKAMCKWHLFDPSITVTCSKTCISLCVNTWQCVEHCSFNNFKQFQQQTMRSHCSTAHHMHVVISCITKKCGLLVADLNKWAALTQCMLTPVY